MTPRSAKQKGSNYERELAAYFNDKLGLDLPVKRALLSGGGLATGGADLVNTPHIHVEAKRTERFQPYKAMEQAEDAIRKGEEKGIFPVVINRKNHVKLEDSMVCMRLEDWIKMYYSFIFYKQYYEQYNE